MVTPRKAKIKAVSAKKRKGDREWAKVTAACVAEHGSRCQGCYERRTLHGHHRLPRSQGGLNIAGNCMVLCDGCHRLVHNHPSIAYQTGFLLHPWDAPLSIGGTSPAPASGEG